MIDHSPAGSWRAARDPEGAACAVCHQNVCAHTDLQYAGLFPAQDALRRHDTGASVASGMSFHDRSDTPVAAVPSSGMIDEISRGIAA
jgi:hypothetical protein